MYTVCWTENGSDYWDRFDSMEEVAQMLIEHHLEDDEDVLIFSPDAEDYLISIQEAFDSAENSDDWESE